MKAEVDEVTSRGSWRLSKIGFPIRSSAVASLLLVLSNDPRHQRYGTGSRITIYHGTLPVWETWKDTMTERLSRREPFEFDENHCNRHGLTSYDDRREAVQLAKGLWDTLDAMEAYVIFESPQAGTTTRCLGQMYGLMCRLYSIDEGLFSLVHGGWPRATRSDIVRW